MYMYLTEDHVDYHLPTLGKKRGNNNNNNSNIVTTTMKAITSTITTIKTKLTVTTKIYIFLTIDTITC
jgi:hypothetical protein